MDLKNKIFIILGFVLSLFVCVNVSADVYTFDFRGMLDNFENSDKLNALHDFINDIGSDSDNIIIYGAPNVLYVVNNIVHVPYNTTDVQGTCGWLLSNGYSQYNYDSNTKSYNFVTQSINAKYSWIYQIIYSSNDYLYNLDFLGNDYNFCTTNYLLTQKAYFNNYSWKSNVDFIEYSSVMYYFVKDGIKIPQYVRYAHSDWLTDKYSYTINYYFDGQLDNSKTYIGSGVQGDTISNFDRYSDNVYSINQSYNFVLSQDNLTFNVYYISSVSYTIEYYFDGQLDNSKTYIGSGALGFRITDYDRYTTDDCVLDQSYNFVLSQDNNIFQVFYNNVEYSLYTIEYYFDGQLDNSKTEILRARVGDIISTFTDYSSSSYSLITENEYVITIQSDSELNLLRIFYESVPLVIDNDIDTSTSDFYLFYNFDDIKKMFPNIDFSNFSHFQQLVITIAFNILFILFILFITYFVLKILFRVIQWFI